MTAAIGASVIRARFDAAPMGRAQIIAVGLTFLLSALDGYDVLSVTFAAPAITAAWNVGHAALGLVLSAGLIGMALGAFTLAPLADTFGRKKMVMVALGLMAIGTLACAYSQTLSQLAFWRVVTGLGIGGCVAIINPVAAEFANARRRALTVSIMAIGYPVGGVTGGVLAAIVLRYYDWRAIFVAGFVASLILGILVASLLPESLSFLLTRQGKGNMGRVNAVLKRCGHSPVDASLTLEPLERRGYAAVFAPGQIGATIWITAASVLFTFSVYFVLSWLPQMVADAGFAPSSASMASATASTVGIAGGLTLGFLAQRGSLRWLTSGAMIGLGVATATFGFTPPSLPLLILTAGICGFFLFGGATGVYATLATTFRDEARASGSGFVSGVGRVSSAAAPLVAGWLFASGLGRREVSMVFAVCAMFSGLILLLGWGRFRPT
jgi:AAHS family 4-hydroxybenzoate transporter-like MFS transporter